MYIQKAGKIICSFLFLFLFAAQACTSQVPDKIPKDIPEFTFYTLKENRPFTRTSLAITGNVVFIFFDPGCSHCRNDIQGISANFDKLKKANFYLISQQEPALVSEFMNTYAQKIQHESNVQVLLDKNYTFLSKFHPVQYPAIYVYGQDRKIKSYLDGEHPIEEILKAVNSY